MRLLPFLAPWQREAAAKSDGLPTLRDEFALAAMQSIISIAPHLPASAPQDIALTAYAVADAMLERRAKC